MEKEVYSNLLPKIIEIETTTNCPINPPCIMCDRAMIKEGFFERFIQNKDISDDILEKLKPILLNAENVSLHVGGEPLACKKLFKIIELINPNAQISFNSNGLLLNKEKIDKILKSNIKGINFSIDAATKETYAKIRLDAFEKVIKNISNLINEKDSRNKKYPWILINMTLMKENYKEVIDFAKLAIKIKANGIKFCPVKVSSIKENRKKGFIFKIEEQKLDPYIEEVREYLKKTKELAEKNKLAFSVYGINLENEGNFYNSLLKNCDCPWKRILVSLGGETRFCCFSSEIIGNLKEQSFNEVWNSKKAMEIRSDLINGIVPENCKCGKSMPY